MSQPNDDEILGTGLARQRVDDVIALDDLRLGDIVGLFFSEDPECTLQMGLGRRSQAFARGPDEANVSEAGAA